MRDLKTLILAALCLMLPSSGALAAQSADVFAVDSAFYVLETDPGLADLPDLAYPVHLAVITLLPGQGYHAYAHAPGAGGLPTELRLDFTPGEDPAEPVQIRYLPGVEQPDLFDPSVMVKVYNDPTPIFLFYAGWPPLAIQAELSLLACSEVNCVPLKIDLNLQPETAPGVLSADLLAQLRSSAPDELQIMRIEKEITPVLATGDPSADLLALLPGSAAQDYPRPDHSRPSPELDNPAQVQAWNFEPRPLRPELEVSGLGKAVLFGLLAGLILNVMPCVLPVLTIKISALLAASGDSQERRRNFRAHNLWFSAGVLTWFTVLALLCGLAGLAWGQIFQSPVVVFSLLLLVFALGLSMFDVFHLPVLDLRLDSSANPRLQAYGSGLMATLLATPCSGPLLGGVLGWSLIQGLPVLITVFLATGIGMALPYLVLAFFPNLANKLPRPGNWMLTFERVMGFLLMATCIYLISILPDAMAVDALIAILLTAGAAWIWGKYGSLRAEGLKKTGLGVLCLALVAGGAYSALAPEPEELVWREFKAAEFNTLLGKENLFVEFTADWCPTCKVLERTSLSSDNLRALTRGYDLTLIRVDMTEFTPEAQALLRALNSASIPLLAVFPAGESANRPVVLRDLYSASQMQDAVQSALARN